MLDFYQFYVEKIKRVNRDRLNKVSGIAILLGLGAEGHRLEEV